MPDFVIFFFFFSLTCHHILTKLLGALRFWPVRHTLILHENRINEVNLTLSEGTGNLSMAVIGCQVSGLHPLKFKNYPRVGLSDLDPYREEDIWMLHKSTYFVLWVSFKNKRKIFNCHWPGLSPPPSLSWWSPWCFPATPFARSHWRLLLDTPGWQCKPSNL